jgi:hypothetical protein
MIAQAGEHCKGQAKDPSDAIICNANGPRKFDNILYYVFVIQNNI